MKMWSHFDPALVWRTAEIAPDPAVVGRVERGIVYLSETWQQRLKLELSSRWRCVVEPPHHYSAHYLDMIEVLNYVQLTYTQGLIEFIFHRLSLPQRTENTGGHFISLSVHLSLSPARCDIRDQVSLFWHNGSDKEMIPKKKGDGAISPLLAP